MLQRRSWKAIAACLALCGFIGINAPAHSQDQPSPQTFNVLSKVPQFSIWNDNPQPGYTLPDGQIMFPHRITMVKLTDAQKLMIGSDLEASVTYYGGCDEFDRVGELVYLSKPKGVAPVPKTITADISKNIPNDIPADIPIELGRFITPFNDAWKGQNVIAKESWSVFPTADLSLYARLLADTTQDVWIGVGGGSAPGYGSPSGPYDPCYANNSGVINELVFLDPFNAIIVSAPLHLFEPNSTTPLTALFKATGFSYSVDFESTKPISDAVAYQVTTLVNGASFSKYPQPTTIPLVRGQKRAKGKLAVILSGHGDEEFVNHNYSLSVNGTKLEKPFNTQMDCTPYSGIQGANAHGYWNRNGTAKRNNWCAGSLVPVTIYDFDATSSDVNWDACGVEIELTSDSGETIDHDDVTINFLSPTEFTMTPTTSSVTLPPGGDGPVDVLLNPLDGFSQMVDISCSVSSPIKDQKLPLCIVNRSGFQKEPVPYNFSSSLPIMVNKPTAVSLDIVGVVTPLPAPVASIANAEPGPYTVIVTGTATDGTVHNATINVQIQ